MKNNLPVRVFTGQDLDGDSVAYFHYVNTNGEHVRYLTEAEIKKYLISLREGAALTFN